MLPDTQKTVAPLAQQKRHRIFLTLVLVFALALPFLYMYATGYRFDIQKPTTLVGTGGLYIGVDQLAAEIFIDDELMRETRTFRRAFYAQGLEVGTHRVHVQKEGYHTWVKELPVTKHRVTVAEAFNLPLVPQVRVLSAWTTTDGVVIIPETLSAATTTHPVVATTTLPASARVPSEEYALRIRAFAPVSETPAVSPVSVTPPAADASAAVATTSITSGGVRLSERDGEVFATWVGSFSQMPYYYCAEEFPRYDEAPVLPVPVLPDEEDDTLEDDFVMHPIQEVSTDVACDPTIRIDRKSQTVRDFDFFPGSTDLVLIVLEDGVYVVEVDDRAWQNAQPLLLGNNLEMHIDGSVIYLYDGVLVYQIFANLEQ